MELQKAIAIWPVSVEYRCNIGFVIESRRNVAAGSNYLKELRYRAGPGSALPACNRQITENSQVAMNRDARWDIEKESSRSVNTGIQRLCKAR
jgi:hypothetical protein